jgi:hypothetical protein
MFIFGNFIPEKNDGFAKIINIKIPATIEIKSAIFCQIEI